MSDTPLQAARQQIEAPEIPSVAELLNDAAKQSVLQVQDYAKMSAGCVANLFSRPRYTRDTLQQMDNIGFGSLPIVLLSGFFIGAVLVMQTGSSFQRFGETSMTVDVVSLAVALGLRRTDRRHGRQCFVSPPRSHHVLAARHCNARVFTLMQGFSKSVVFAFILSTVGCYQGLNVRGGTQGVGRATTQAVVVSSVMIIVADTFLTRIALYLAGKL